MPAALAHLPSPPPYNVHLMMTSRDDTGKEEDLLGSGSDFDGVDTNDVLSDSDFFKALEGRKEELRDGIGKRYITRTQRGFLNVHEEVSHCFFVFFIYRISLIIISFSLTHCIVFF